MDEYLKRTPMRAYYQDKIERFVSIGDPKAIVDFLTESSEEKDESLSLQRGAWINQIRILKKCLKGKEGFIIFEYSILRLNARIDVVLIMDNIIYSLEFKNDQDQFLPEEMNQADGYGYALKNFHYESRDKLVAPLLVATRAPSSICSESSNLGIDGLFSLFKANPEKMMDYINAVSEKFGSKTPFTEEDFEKWISSPFKPNPTIIESARYIYSHNRVDEFWMFDAGEENLSKTEKTVYSLIEEAKAKQKKLICFVTGVPGAGKTLVGLDLAGKSRNNDGTENPRAIFFSGNGPLINVLTTQLGRDAMRQNPDKYPKEYRAIQDVKAFIQDLHAFKRDLLSSINYVPDENVLIFDEAQRVWDEGQMETWFQKKKSKVDLNGRSEADLLLDSLKEKPWAVIVALVGLGQDIHVGENGIKTWFLSLLRKHQDWDVAISPEIWNQNADTLSDIKSELLSLPRVRQCKGLYLTTSLRTPRAKNMSIFAEALLNNDPSAAKQALKGFDHYPIYVTRDLEKAKKWVLENRIRKERCGALYSSNGKNIRKAFKPLDNRFVARWFLDETGPDSSNSLTYAASEFDVQGLELDWVLLGWDMDMYRKNGDWHKQRMLSGRFFKESDDIQKKHILNSYRVLLTRARKGIIIYVPKENDFDDLYQLNSCYEPVYEYLKSCGIPDLADNGIPKPIEKAIVLPF